MKQIKIPERTLFDALIQEAYVLLAQAKHKTGSKLVRKELARIQREISGMLGVPEK